jgi:hypothetical protein
MSDFGGSACEGLRLNGADRAPARGAGRHRAVFTVSQLAPGATVDCVVAATTEALDAELLTLNVEHFPMRLGLEPAFSPRISPNAGSTWAGHEHTGESG